MLKNSKKNTGFSLIGLLIAVFIIVMVLMASGRIFGTAQQTATLAREKFIALNSAREGLELVHAVRDNNWFSSDDRTLWLDHGLCSDGVTKFTDTNRTIVIDPLVVQHIDTAKDGSGDLFIDLSLKQWTHQATSEKTPYNRKIVIDCSTKDNDPAFITVTSTVTWKSSDQDKSVVLKEQLFNWLPSQRKINP